MALTYPETEVPSSTLLAYCSRPTPANPIDPARVPSSPPSSTSTSSLPTSIEELDGESFAFGMEKGFWRIEQGALELLRFTKLFQQHRDNMSDSARASVKPLPKEIDLISMSQLSYGVLRAVDDLRLHHHKAADDQHLRSSNIKARKKRTSRLRKGKGPSIYSTTTAARTAKMSKSCEECFCTNTPVWRSDPMGRTLCNVCGLVYAKRCQKYKDRSRYG